MNPWILIAESGDFIEVPKGTFGAFKVSLDELLALQKGIMGDEQLKAAASRGFANPSHLEELLTRTDIPQSRLLRVRANLSSALSSSHISSENLQAIISKLKSAKTLDEFDQVFAELRHPNRLIHSGAVAENSSIFTSAKKGNEYTLGSTKVKIDPVSEADALYLAKDGSIHIDEVKNTASALRDKLLKIPDQLQRMKDWCNLDSRNRKIGIIIETESGWTDLFAARPGETAALKILIDGQVPLTIASCNLTVSKMDDLWNAVMRKYKKLRIQGMWSNWNNFYSQMSTLKEAETFLEISLK
ncbi:MAG: hypothetical protein KME64_44190 [Scytonematopsis contorta HA4267-MV1]|jgi:hypothetical protein|nr:hypothetical protein [Scytonematopsis contorta HA4267-MV1]